VSTTLNTTALKGKELDFNEEVDILVMKPLAIFISFTTRYACDSLETYSSSNDFLFLIACLNFAYAHLLVSCIYP